jgi:hypothetical protein
MKWGDVKRELLKAGVDENDQIDMYIEYDDEYVKITRSGNKVFVHGCTEIMKLGGVGGY